MIDIESEVFSTVANALRSRHDGISVYGEYVDVPSSFPSVSIVEDDNYQPDINVALIGGMENVVSVMYTVNIYSNLGSAKKSQAKAILDTVDSEMRDMGFVRTSTMQVPNMDRTIYRMTARYKATLQKI